MPRWRNKPALPAGDLGLLWGPGTLPAQQGSFHESTSEQRMFSWIQLCLKSTPGPSSSVNLPVWFNLFGLGLLSLPSERDLVNTHLPVSQTCATFLALCPLSLKVSGTPSP